MEDNKNKLNFDTIVDDSKKYEVVERVEFSNGTYLNVRPFITREDLENIVESYGVFLQDDSINKLIGKNELYLFLQCFIILNNTDIADDGRISTNKEKLKFGKLLINNLTLFNDIMKQIDEVAIKMVVEKFSEVVKIAAELESIKERNERKKKMREDARDKSK